MSADPTPRKSVLLVGLDPGAVDFSQFPGLDEARLRAGIEAGLRATLAAGFAAEWCLTGSDPEAAEAAVRERLAAGEYAAVMIGAGMRTPADQVELFERIVNLVREVAPRARLCFNTSPDTTCAAVLRWLQP